MLIRLLGTLFLLAGMVCFTAEAEARGCRGRLLGRHHHPVRNLFHRFHDRRCEAGLERIGMPREEREESQLAGKACGCGGEGPCECGLDCPCASKTALIQE